jgi:TetR/AcrR family transcriptional regulator, repressor of fatR-cypB operon
VRQKDDKKIEQIFNATLKAVEQRGLSGITICDISKAAGIATGTLYIYFKNKEDLINELFLDCRNESAGFYFKDYTGGNDFKEAFQKIFFNIIDYRLSHFEESVFLEQCYHSPFVNDNQRQVALQVLQPVFQLLDKGKEEGIIKDVDNRLLWWCVIGAINEVVKGCYYNNREMAETVISSLFDICWDGIKK